MRNPRNQLRRRVVSFTVALAAACVAGGIALLMATSVGATPRPAAVLVGAPTAGGSRLAPSPSGGYWLAGPDGSVADEGGAIGYGSMGGKALNAPIVGIAATPDGHGYWLVASDGGVFAFGDAGFLGSMGGKALDAPIVGIASDGHGYWLVASDGGIFAFGDAGFFGSMGGKALNAPIVGIAATPDGHGYWLVASDGGIFSFGDALFFGSGEAAGASVIGLVTDQGGFGYQVIDAAGQPVALTPTVRGAVLSTTLTDSGGGTSKSWVTGAAVPGTPLDYTLMVLNRGPSAVDGATVSDVLPAVVASDTWAITSTTDGASAARPEGGGPVVGSFDVPVGASITWSIRADLPPAATGVVTDTAAVTLPSDYLDPAPWGNTAFTTDRLTPEADVTETNTPSATVVAPGSTLTFTVVVANSGPSDAYGNFFDSIGTNAADFSWTAATTDGATVARSGGVGLEFGGLIPGGDQITIPPGATITFTISGTVSDSNEEIFNTAAPGLQDGLFPVFSTVDVSLTPSPDLNLSVDDGVANGVPGASFNFQVFLSNNGTDDANDVSIADTLPTQGLENVSSPNLPAGVTFDASTDVWTVSSLAPGQSIDVNLEGTIPSGATGTLIDSAVASASNADSVTASLTTTLIPQASVAVTLTDSAGGSSITSAVGSVIAGTTETFQVSVSNSGPSDATNVKVDGILPSQGLDDVTSPDLPVGVTFNPSTDIWTISTLAAGDSVTLTLSGTVPTSASGTSTATVSSTLIGAPPDWATDVDTVIPLTELTLTNSDGVASVTPGDVDTYTLTVQNPGSATANDVSVTDTLPSQGLGDITSPDLPNGVTFDASTDTWTIGTLAAGNSVVLTLSGTVPSGASGTYSDVAAVSASNAPSATATDTDTLEPESILTVALVDSDGGSSVANTVGAAVPGQAITYTTTVANTGPSDATDVSLADVLPSQELEDIASPNLPVGITFNTGTDVWTIGTLAAGTSVTLTLTGTIPASATGTASDTVTVSASDATTVSATDSDTLNSVANLTASLVDSDGGSSISNTAGATAPGEAITYTATIDNTGPGDATNVSVADTLPAQGLQDFASPTLPNGVVFNSVTDTWTIGTLADGASVVLTLTGTIRPGASGTASDVVVTSASNAPSVTATDTDSLVPLANLAVTISDGLSQVTPGSADTYTVVVTNTGPSDATNVEVVDTLPAQGFENIASPDLPNGVIFNAATDTWSVGTLSAGATVTLTLTGMIPASATGTFSQSATVDGSGARSVDATDVDTLT